MPWFRSAAPLAIAFAAAACSNADAGPAPDAPTAASKAPTASAPAAAPAKADPIRRLVVAAGSGVSTVRDPALAALSALAAGGDAAAGRRAAEVALAANDVVLRRGGARVLERIGGADSVPALTAALSRPDTIEEDSLVRALARIATSDAGRALVAACLGDDQRRAILAGQALSDFAGPFDLAAIRASAASAPRVHTRQAALFALGGHAAADDRAVFAAASRDDAAPIRVAAVRGLFTFAPVAAADLRRMMRDDPDATVRRVAAAEAVRARGDDVVRALAGAAAEFDEDVSFAAVETLAKRPEPAAFDALLDVVRDDSRSAHLRGTAARRAAAIDRDRTVAMLKYESAIFDLETRVYCDEILAAQARR